jgi:hypothetical protein
MKAIAGTIPSVSGLQELYEALKSYIFTLPAGVPFLFMSMPKRFAFNACFLKRGIILSHITYPEAESIQKIEK